MRPFEDAAKRARWATAAFFVADGVGFGVWAAHVPVFKQNLRLSASSLSAVLLALVLGSILTMPLAGHLVARLGSRAVARAAVAAYVLSIAGLSCTDNFWSLVLLAGAFGAAKGALDVSINAQGVWVERQIGKHVVSSFQGFWSVGGLLGAGVSSYAIRHGHGVREDFLGTAFVLLVCATASSPFLLKEEKREGETIRWRMPDPRLLRLAGVAFLGLFAEGAMADWDGVYLKTSVGVSLAQAAIGYAVFSIAMATGRFIGDALIARFNSATILRVCGFLLFAGMSFALTLNMWWAALFGFACAGLGLSNIVPVVWGVAGRNQVIGAGPALATVTTVGYFGFLAGPPLIGALATVLSVRLALVTVALFGIAISFSSRIVAPAAG